MSTVDAEFDLIAGPEETPVVVLGRQLSMKQSTGTDAHAETVVDMFSIAADWHNPPRRSDDAPVIAAMRRKERFARPCARRHSF